MRFRHFLSLHRDSNAAGAGGGGGSSASAAPRRRAASPYRDEPRRSPTSLVDSFVARHGSLEAALQAVARENADLVENVDGLTREVADLKGKVPADGAVVLLGDDAKAWPEFKALNLAPAKVKEQLTAGETAAKQLADRTARDLRNDGAKIAGFKPTVWDLTKTAGLHVDVREETVEKDGKQEKVQRTYVRPQDKADAPLELLDAFVKREAPDLYDSLRASANGGAAGASGGAGAGTADTTQVVPFAGQPAGGGAPADPVAAMLAHKEAQRLATGNALMPPVPAKAT